MVTNLQIPRRLAPVPKPPSWLRGDWRFVEGAGTVSGDLSRYRNQGTLVGCSWGTGEIGSALSFSDGNEYLRIADAPSLRLDGPFTLVAKIKRDATQANGYGVAVTKGINYILYTLNNGKVGFGYQDTGGSWREFYTTDLIAADEWHTIIVTAVPSTTTACVIYLDGVASKSQTLTGVPTTSSYAVFIGRAWYDDYRYKGLIDVVMILGLALSASEVAALHAAIS